MFDYAGESFVVRSPQHVLGAFRKVKLPLYTHHNYVPQVTGVLYEVTDGGELWYATDDIERAYNMFRIFEHTKTRQVRMSRATITAAVTRVVDNAYATAYPAELNFLGTSVYPQLCLNYELIRRNW
jgi:hypothetical protein